MFLCFAYGHTSDEKTAEKNKTHTNKMHINRVKTKIDEDRY